MLTDFRKQAEKERERKKEMEGNAVREHVVELPRNLFEVAVGYGKALGEACQKSGIGDQTLTYGP